MSLASDATPRAGTTTTAAADRISFAERFSDRMNPILVKEVRQAFKGRGFSITFGLLLISCWFVSVIGALQAGTGLEYFDYARQFFASYIVPLAVATCVVVPFLAYQSMLGERLDDTFEMLSITTLRARRIISGKLASAAVQIFLFYAAITPFIGFTSLLQGFQLAPVVVSLFVGIFVALALCSAALFISTLARSRMFQGLLALLLIAGLLWVLSLIITLMFSFALWSMPGGWEFIAASGAVCLILVGAILLLREMAIAQITFESDNRSSGIRIICSVFLVVGLAATFGLMIALGAPIYPETCFSVVIAGCLLLAFVGFSICTEPPRMTRRVRTQVAHVPWLLSVFAQPWLPGCARGYMYMLLHIASFAALLMVVSPLLMPGRYPGTGEMLAVAAGCLFYLAIYAGLLSCLATLMFRSVPGCRTAHVRWAGFVLIMAGILGPLTGMLLLELLFNVHVRFGFWMIASPVSTLPMIANGISGWDGTAILALLFPLALLFFLLNLGGIIESLRETRGMRKSSPSRGTPPPREANPDAPSIA